MKIITVEIPDGALLYNENGLALYNPDEGLLSVIKIGDISEVQYEFDRKHLGSVSGSESKAHAGMVGAALGLVIAGLIFEDLDVDIGDVATAGVAGAIAGGGSKKQTMRNEYEEHAVVDVYSTANILSHLTVDFGAQQKPAKRFFSYMQNAIKNKK